MGPSCGVCKTSSSKTDLLLDPNFEWGPPGSSARFTGVPDGCDALLLAGLLDRTTQPLLHVSSDDLGMNRLAEAVAFFAPGTRILKFPAWDCLPYDRVPPRAELVAERMATLGALSNISDGDAGKPTLVLTTVAAILQRVPPRARIAAARIELAPGRSVDFKHVMAFLAANGFHRTETVREPGGIRQPRRHHRSVPARQFPSPCASTCSATISRGSAASTR